MSATRYQWNRELVAQRRIGKESVLIPIASDAGNLNSFFQMNPTASLVWDLAVQGKTATEIASVLYEKFEVDADEALQDVEELLAKFVDLKALEAIES